MALRESALRNERFTEKERRNLAILDIIRRSRETSRAEISRVTHLNIVTISNYIDDYISKNLVLEKGLDVSTGGRRPELLELNSKFGYSVGIDLGSPHIMDDVSVIAIMIDATGKTIVKVKAAKEEVSQEKFIEQVVGLLGELITKSKVDKSKIKGVGIGIWGVLDRHKGAVRYAVEKGGIFSYAELQAAIERQHDLFSMVEHDATCGALGEKWMGLGINTNSEDIIYMCSDSSCGLILNGELYYGASKSAGELNLNPPSVDFRDLSCWAKYDYGCGFRSRGIDLGILSRVKGYFRDDNAKNSKIMELVKGKIENINMNVIIEAGRAHDEVAIKILADAGDYLGAKIAFLINLFNPDAVVIGRGIEKCGEIFLEAVRRSVKKWAYEESMRIARIVPTSLGEESIASGAAALVMQQVFAKI